MPWRSKHGRDHGRGQREPPRKPVASNPRIPFDGRPLLPTPALSFSTISSRVVSYPPGSQSPSTQLPSTQPSSTQSYTPSPSVNTQSWSSAGLSPAGGRAQAASVAGTNSLSVSTGQSKSQRTVSPALSSSLAAGGDGVPVVVSSSTQLNFTTQTQASTHTNQSSTPTSHANHKGAIIAAIVIPVVLALAIIALGIRYSIRRHRTFTRLGSGISSLEPTPQKDTPAASPVDILAATNSRIATPVGSSIGTPAASRADIFTTMNSRIVSPVGSSIRSASATLSAFHPFFARRGSSAQGTRSEALHTLWPVLFMHSARSCRSSFVPLTVIPYTSYVPPGTSPCVTSSPFSRVSCNDSCRTPFRLSVQDCQTTH
ncbi:hypothetical protein JB92DRAFT_1562193 [Gautieria morchelliformis]|nr:hypothetical protein JB92DRAFT_1562193 [Gautieria morchelliformis]